MSYAAFSCDFFRFLYFLLIPVPLTDTLPVTTACISILIRFFKFISIS